MNHTATDEADADTDTHTLNVLVVEDERDLQELLRYNLVREGHNVAAATTGEAALEQIEDNPPDIILLDLMLPGMDGLEVCRVLKADPTTSAIPIIMITARGEESDVVAGLEMGADDYIPKPFSPRVLIARMHAVARRVGESDDGGGSEQVKVRNMTIDAQRHEVRVGDTRIDLTATEFRLLSLLASRPGRVFTRKQIIEMIHDGFAAVTDRSVDVQVVALRRKLGEAGEDIETVRGVGYRFKDE